MEYIVKAKERVQTSVLPEVYELSIPEEVDDVNGNKVTILKSIGTFNLDDLIRQRDMISKQLSEIDSKIDAINKIKNGK